ncbi:MAG: alkaline phosphatase family protein [Acidobacteriota bacterium]
MTLGLAALKHLVVLMMENRSFDHMLGGLNGVNAVNGIGGIDGLTGAETNPDVNGTPVKVESKAQYQGQLDPDPDHHFAAVNKQIFGGGPGNPMQGFVTSYFDQQHNLNQAKKIMYYFQPDKLPVLTNLATEFAVFNRWFASIPGPTLCNRAFAHYGTSFGNVGMELFFAGKQFKSIYERLLAAGVSSRVYYFDAASSTLEVPNILANQPQLFGTFSQFVQDCANDQLPAYSFIEPNYTDHADASGATWIASDQHPDHHVREGERFIAQVYNALRRNPVWTKSALLVVYDEHGGIYDHVVPPAVVTDGFVAQPAATGTNEAFHFDRLGVRVPAILASPWIPKGTVVNGRVFEHASIPATVTDWQIGLFNDRSPREKNAETFLDLLTAPAPRADCIEFQL